MGRLFEYNRFSNDEDIKKDSAVNKEKEFMQKSQSPRTTKSKKTEEKYETLVCPSYSELYPDSDNNGGSGRVVGVDAPMTKDDPTKRTKSTRKSVEIAIKKYHQLSKFLIQSQDDDDDDDEMIASAVAPKKPRVYDCMRDFLRKKFFQQTVSEESDAAEEYDEVDYLSVMDSYDVKDADGNDDDDDDERQEDELDDDDDECLLVVTSSHQKRSRCKRLVDTGCWPNNGLYTDEGCDIDSDAGIKDCCQLLASGGSPKADKSNKSPKRKPIELPSELRDAAWFQPNISGKTAIERLTKEAPGAFIIRQSSSVKPGNYLLCLRMETKVKKFVILGSPRCYKIKGAKKEFSSLKALVTHHSVMAEQLPVTLTLPRTLDEKPSHRYLDDFDTFESLQILGILKFLQSKNLEFS